MVRLKDELVVGVKALPLGAVFANESKAVFRLEGVVEESVVKENAAIELVA